VESQVIARKGQTHQIASKCLFVLDMQIVAGSKYNIIIKSNSGPHFAKLVSYKDLTMKIETEQAGDTIFFDEVCNRHTHDIHKNKK